MYVILIYMYKEIDMVEKKKITLSIPVETDEKLNVLAVKFGMTKSGLVNFLINQVDEVGTIYSK